MKWRVEWVTTAEDELATIWVNALDRDVITEAANLIDQRLARDPYDESESRPNGERIAFEKPLAVRYQVIPEDRLVKVLFVWRY
jgi:hypothetical protein